MPTGRSPLSRRSFCRRAGCLLGGVSASASALGASKPLPGIVGVTHGGMDLGTPPSRPEGETWHYQVTLPLQVAPRRAAVFCNIRIGFAPGVDFENGADVIVFDDPAHVDVKRAVPLMRNHEEVTDNADPPGTPSVMVKYISRGGFVPFAARRADGAPHPHAGTGFALNQALEWPSDAKRIRKRRPTFRDGAVPLQYFELQQLRYDGKRVHVTSRERVELTGFVDGWTMRDGAMTNAIPDGDDLLLPITGTRRGGGSGSGVMRWRREATAWKPVAFQYVTDDDGSCEPSLIRDMDGSLLFASRGVPGPYQQHIRVWRAGATGERWVKIIDIPGIVPGTPITLNQAADGTPYIAANEKQAHTREKLLIQPLNRARTALEKPVVVRDCLAEFGPAPSRTSWNADHPSATTVQLADGRWHNVLGFRILDRGELTAGTPPTPHTGAYLEEVLSRGPERPVWHF